jgi:hypothetical protein
MGSLAAVQVLVVLHVALSLIVVPHSVAGISYRLLAWLMAGSVLGFPAGLALFLRANVHTLKLAVGIAAIAFGLLLMKREWGHPAELPPGGSIEHRPLRALAVGVLSGALTAVLVVPGPIAMLYLRALGVMKEASRATSLTFFAFCYVMVTALHALWGDMKGESWLLAVLLLPTVVVGAVVGHLASRHLTEQRFRTSVLALLTLSGAYAIWSAV